MLIRRRKNVNLRERTKNRFAVRTKNRFSNLTIESDVAHCVSESNQDSVSDKNLSSEHSTKYSGQTNDSDQTSPSHSNERASFNSISDLSSELEYNLNSNLTFKPKGIHFCNLNVHHIVPKIDELRISMAHDICPDIFGLCETFLTDSISEDQIAIDGYDILRKDISDTQKKAGGGVVLYY